jgi:uncharacterized protein YdaU (DUF1376 family)
MATDHYLPLFVGDFLASTALWDGPEKALYGLCLMVEWASGPLPADASRLARILGYEKNEFDNLWITVGKKFKRSHGGLINDRLETVRENNYKIQENKSSNARDAALKSWESRRARKATADANACAKEDANAYANAMHPNRTEPNQSDPNRVSERHTPLGCEPRSGPTPEKILAAYPHTPNGSGMAALKAIEFLISSGEAQPVELLDGAMRYALFVAAGGVSGTQFVKSPHRFFAPTRPDCPAPWSQAWEPPKSKGDLRQDRNISAVKAYLAGST